MAEEGGMAFARLCLQRRAELDLSAVDIAVRTGRPIEVVVAWDQGTAVPDADELAQVAEVLDLPLPLLKEALRRVADYRLDAPPVESSPEPSPVVDEPAGLVREPPDSSTLTIDTTIPFTERLLEAATSTVGAVTGIFTDVRQSASRRRRMARAPTAHPSYIEDRNQMVTYRLRMVFTAAGVAVLALILRWSLGGLGSAISDLWNALTGAL